MNAAITGLELRSEATSGGELRLTLEEVQLDPPAADEVIVRVEATPINPSDLGLLLGPADISTMRVTGSATRPGLTFSIPDDRLSGIKARLDQSMPVGNEGAGTVIAVGDQATAFQGRKVGMLGGGMYTQYRKLTTRDVVALPDQVDVADGASMFVNPLTSLGFVETAKAGGHQAIVHTAAASNLGQMLQKVCLADAIPLVNIVRSTEQAKILTNLGARHVLNSKDADFTARLVDAIAQTGATVAFDAIGGGRLGSDVMQAMEEAAVRNMTEYSRYGSNTFKQLYIYGGLDLSPTTLNSRAFGFQWSISGWLLTPFLQKSGPEVVQRLQRRVVDELTTTFASSYTKTIGLADVLAPEVISEYQRKRTGEKYLIDPSR